MQKWIPGFCPATAHITRMAAWIRVAAIQLECFDVWSLKRIGNLVGKLLKIDSLTTSQNRGKFARLCVELDLTKPLEAFVQINQHWYNIEYEGLLEICYMCGKYGQKREVCPLRAEVQYEKTPEMPIKEGSVDMNTDSGDEVNKLKDWDSGLRGPWMNVQPRRKYKTNFKDGGGKNAGGTSKGSRFDALRQVGEDFGRDVNGLGGEPSLSFKTGKNMENIGSKGSKIWTKSKSTKDTSRQDKKVRQPFGTSFDFSNSTGVAQFNGKEFGHPGLGSEKIDSWVGNHDASIENGVYIFGYQPPNIREQGVNSEASFESEDDAGAINAYTGDDVGQNENMDLSEGQGVGSDAHMTGHALNSEGGVTFDI
ncbi:unnamed protein product [Prunus armeniaca]